MTEKRSVCNRTWKHCLLGILLIWAVMPYVNLAQLSTASLTGVITDTSGAVMPGVRVSAVHVETNTSHEAVSNSAGRYVFLNLPTGRYTLTAKYKGFETALRTNVLLSADQAANLNFTMRPGAATIVVNVPGIEIDARRSVRKSEHPPRDVCYRSFGRTQNTITGRVNDGSKPTAIDSAHQVGKKFRATDKFRRAGGAGGVGAGAEGVEEGGRRSGRPEVGARVSAA